MNSAELYFEEKMQNEEFSKQYIIEKKKLDIEFLLDDLTQKIQMESSYNDLLKSVKRIKKTLKAV